jgi:hypothetical protein
MMLASGTKLYVFDSVVVTYFERINGRIVEHREAYPDANLKVTMTPTAVILTGPDHFYHVFPPSATVVHDPNSISIVYVWPGMTAPRRIIGRRPDYVVP